MLKLNVGTNRKIGQPDYGSAGASCNLEVELDTALFHDLDGLHHVVQRAYAACNQAVNDELARLTHSGLHAQHTAHASAESDHTAAIHDVAISPVIQGARITTLQASTSNGQHTHHTEHSPSRPSPRPATASQVKAIRAICSRHRIDLVSLLRYRYGLTTADELGIRQASDLIDELKNGSSDPHPGTNGHAPANGHGSTNGAYAVTGGAR